MPAPFGTASHVGLLPDGAGKEVATLALTNNEGSPQAVQIQVVSIGDPATWGQLAQVDTNGYLQVKLGNVTVDSGGFVVCRNFNATQQFVDYAPATLAANATATCPSHDTGANSSAVGPGYSSFRGVINVATASTAGSYSVQQSNDAATWYSTTAATAAATVGVFSFNAPVIMRYVRVIYVNGTGAGTAQGAAFAIYTSLVAI